MPKILATGGAGFIGSHIVDRFIELGHDIGLGRPVSVNAIYRLLVDMTGIAIGVERGPKRMGDVRLFTLDCSNAAHELGWTPRASFEDGVARTLVGFSNNG